MKKLHRMWTTGDLKKIKVLHVAWSERLRKRDGQVLIQLSTHWVKCSFSEVFIQWSTHSVKCSFSKYPFSEVLIQRNNLPVKYSFSYDRNCVSRKKIKEIYFDCSAFAIVFLRANHASATVLHMEGDNAPQAWYPPKLNSWYYVYFEIYSIDCSLSKDYLKLCPWLWFHVTILTGTNLIYKHKKKNKINRCTVVKSSYIPPQVLQAPTEVSHSPLHWFAIYRELELWSVLLVFQLGNYLNQQQHTILGS